MGWDQDSKIEISVVRENQGAKSRILTAAGARASEPGHIPNNGTAFKSLDLVIKDINAKWGMLN